MSHPEDEPESEDLDKTVPSPMCDGDLSCTADVEVIFLRTGAKMCAEHALDHCTYMVARDREERDTDPAAPGGSPTLPPLSEVRERESD